VTHENYRGCVASLLPFHLHPVVIAVLLAAALVHRRIVASTHQRKLALYALMAFAIVTLWPIGDLAASVSLSVATLQRLVIMLLVAPLLLLSLPPSLLARLTRPTFVDNVVAVVSHPGVALALVTVVGTATLTVPIVDAGAHSTIFRGLTLIVVLVCGLVLWIPALAIMPGTRRLSSSARAGYLFVSSLVVTSFSFVWIFARHSLYPALHDQRALLHVSPLFDQEFAGFLAKFGAYAPMWSIAFALFARADRDDTRSLDGASFLVDVEREMLRGERQRSRERRHRVN
jgi:cytochrome c oxidase assembly factor CtaG